MSKTAKKHAKKRVVKRAVKRARWTAAMGKAIAKGLEKNPADHIKIEFGHLELVDATEPLRLQPLPCDIEGAVRKDPMRCMFTKCTSRMYGATKVIFWKSSAYIDLVGPDGIRRVYRYVVSHAMVKLMKAFDRGQPFDEGRAFILLPPSPSKSLKVMRAKAKCYNKSENGKIMRRAQMARHAQKRATLVMQAARAYLEKVKTAPAAESPAALAEQERAKAALDSAVQDVKEKRAEAEEAWKNASKVSTRPVTPPGEPHKFDMTTRNGQGHYNFVPRAPEAR